MSRNRLFLASVFVTIFFACSAALAQEQWLRYRVWDGQGQLPPSGYVSPNAAAQAPTGLAIPKFAGVSQIFARWETPMVKSGGIWLALDRSKKDGSYDRLYVDSNADGSLADEIPIKPYQDSNGTAEFGPVKVMLESEDGPTTYHINVVAYVVRMEMLFMGAKPSETVRVIIQPSGWYEGAVTIGGKPWRCRLIDYDVNGTFNDTSSKTQAMDRIEIGPPGDPPAAQLDTLFLGKYVEVDGNLYRVEAARDGAWVTFTKDEHVPTGTLRVAPEIAQIDIGADIGYFHRKPVNGVATVPAGKYRVEMWRIDRKDAKGANWRLEARTYSNIAPFEVTAGHETKIDCGEPVIEIVASSKGDEQWSISQSLRGRSGESISLTLNGAQPPAPNIRIKNGDGSYNRVFSTSYG